MSRIFVIPMGRIILHETEEDITNVFSTCITWAFEAAIVSRNKLQVNNM